MPLVPNNGKLYIELSSERAVADLVAAARTLDPDKVATFGTKDSRVAADIADHLFYLSAVHPEWLAEHRDDAVTELLGRMPMDAGSASTLLPGLEASSIDQLCERLDQDPDDWSLLSLLVGSGDPTGLLAVADVVRRTGERRWANRLGVHVGEDGPGIRRWTPCRYSIAVADGTAEPNAFVGLDLDEVAQDPDDVITWHFVSLPPRVVDGAPSWPAELVHIISPRADIYTVHCRVLEDGRYVEPIAEVDHEPYHDRFREAESDAPATADAYVRRFDDDLTYRNGHVFMTPNVFGVAGGPPIGLYPNPECPTCGLLMFHIATVESTIREYGDGFRSVFLCEGCARAAVVGTGWN